MKKLISISVLVIMLSGCATSYHKWGNIGKYSETKIQDNIYKVRFYGNVSCGMNRAKDCVLLRSAEVTLENGYKYFVILDEKSWEEVAGQTYGSSCCGLPQSTTISSSRKTAYCNKPRAEKTIKCFKEKPEDVSTIVYDAEQVRRDIKKEDLL